jgi:hypothetical protein
MTGAIGMMFGNRTPPAAAAGGGDATFAQVQLLLSGGETNNSTTVKDYSANNWGSWTTSASFKYSSTQAKFASTSLFLGASADIRRAWVGTNLAFPAYASTGETGDWTIEMWIYPTASQGGIMSQHTFGPLLLLFNNDYTVYHEMGASTGGTTGEFSTTIAMTANAWNHFAVTRKNNTNTAWVGGVSAGTATSTASQRTVQYGGNPDAYEIGSFNGTGSNKLAAYIEDFRYTKGKARYTATFSPPTASFPKS